MFCNYYAINLHNGIQIILLNIRLFHDPWLGVPAKTKNAGYRPGRFYFESFCKQAYNSYNKNAPFGAFFVFAERMGFEPMTHFWRVHALQACSFDHSDISP
jgi:hypothetical protein